MSERRYQFDLFRLNKVFGEPNLFNQTPKNIDSDLDIEAVVRHATEPRFTYFAESEVRKYRWDLREFSQTEYALRPVMTVRLARSLTYTEGVVVTDKGIEESSAELVPPLADTADLLFDMARHLVAVEHVTLTSSSRRWKSALQDLLEQSAVDLGYSGRIELEPVPAQQDITEAFRSIERLTRLRLTLRLPNPELTRYARRLHEQMQNGQIREFLQDMKNPNGLNKEDGQLPHSAIQIAESGYKKGDVVLEGFSDNKHVTKRVGNKAARGELEMVRDVVRGMREIADTKEGKRIIDAILKEIDRLHPRENGDPE